jgi:glycerophosphoryl diester phosphodiesterase
VAAFDLQGHRGARGLRPENTLPSFEAALDAGVCSIETDVHLTAEQIPILFHDHALSERFCRLLPGGTGPVPSARPLLRTLTLAQFRRYRADINPDPQRFPAQDPGVTPLAAAFSVARGMDPYTLPTLAEFFAFVAAYAGEQGAAAGKTPRQQERARQVCLDLELKRVPFHPELLGDGYDAVHPGALESLVVEAVREAGLVRQVAVRSFDHRCVLHVKRLEPDLRTAVLVEGTAPVQPAAITRRAGAGTYCPDVDFLDRLQVRQLHKAGLRVVPWTVNEPADWERLLDWGVDGITTDYPDRLAEWLRARGIDF